MLFSCDETRQAIGIGYFMKAANERGTQNLVKLSNCWATSGAEPAVRKSYKTVHKKKNGYCDGTMSRERIGTV